MSNIAVKLKALFSRGVAPRTAAFQNLTLIGKIRGILAKKLTEATNLPKAIIEALKDTKVFKIERLKDGRVKIWGKSGHGKVIERFLFSGGDSPRLIKKTRINHTFATTEIHKPPVAGFSDTGYSITRRIDRDMMPLSVDSFRTKRLVKFDKSSEWQDVTEHITLTATTRAGNKFNVGKRSLDIVPIYNDTPSLKSRPIFDVGSHFITLESLSVKEALAAVKQRKIPPIDTSKAALFSCVKTNMPVTINAYQRQLWRI